MVEEYSKGERYPVGEGGSAGGRGDNYAGGEGYHGYGPGAIMALVNRDAKLTDRQTLMDGMQKLRETLRLLTGLRGRKINEPRYYGGSDEIKTGDDIYDDKQIQDAVDAQVASIRAEVAKLAQQKSQAVKEKDVLTAEAVANLVEYWLQLELLKIPYSPSLGSDQKKYNSQLEDMQTMIFHFDEALLATFMGLDGYFSGYEGGDGFDTWADSFKDEIRMNGNQIMWLNRTALAVAEKAKSMADIMSFVRSAYSS
jgi:hypothetical protein